MLIPDNIGQLKKYLETFTDEDEDIPVFVESGSHKYDSDNYLFIVSIESGKMVFKPIKFDGQGYPRPSWESTD